MSASTDNWAEDRNTERNWGAEPWAKSRDAVPEGHVQITVYDEKTGKRVATVFEAGAVDIIAAAPLLPEMAAVLESALDDWPGFDDEDEPVSGADLVEWFGNYRGRVRAALAKWRATQ